MSSSPPAGGLGLGVKIGFAAAALVVLVLVISVIVTALSRLSGGGDDAIGQLGGAYHQGEAAPSGELAWSTEIADDSGFAPARSGTTVIVAANTSTASVAASFSPPGLPEELLDQVQQFHGQMLAKGYERFGDVEKTALQSGQDARFRTKLEKGACYQVGAFGGDKAQDLDLLLYHDDGVRLIIADTRGDRDAHLKHCPVKSELFEFEMRMHRGHGVAASVVYRESTTPFHATGHLYGISPTKGEIRWDRELVAQIASAPAATDRFIAVGTRRRQRTKGTRRLIEAGALSVFTAENGEPRCTFEALGPVTSRPIVVDEIAYFGSCGVDASESADASAVCDPSVVVTSRAYAVRLEDCSVVWTYDAPFPIVSPPAAGSAKVFFAAGTKVYAVDRRTGELQWASELHMPAIAPVVSGGVVIAGSDNGSIRGLDASDGSMSWVYEADIPLRAVPAVDDRAAYVGLSDGTMVALGRESGERLWERRAPAPIESAIGVAAGLVFTVGRDRVVAFDPEGGEPRFEVPFEGEVGPGCAAILTEGTLVFADQGGMVHAIR